MFAAGAGVAVACVAFEFAPEALLGVTELCVVPLVSAGSGCAGLCLALAKYLAGGIGRTAQYTGLCCALGYALAAGSKFLI